MSLSLGLNIILKTNFLMETQSYDFASIRKFSGLSATEEKSLMKWYSSLGTEARVHFTAKAYNRFRNVPDRHITWKGKLTELQYATFLMELANYKRSISDTHKKLKNTSNSDPSGIIDEIVAGSVEASRKASKKRRFISLRAYSVIKELKNQEKSWRFISRYLKKKFRLTKENEISHVYLARVWRELKHEDK